MHSSSELRGSEAAAASWLRSTAVGRHRHHDRRVVADGSRGLQPTVTATRSLVSRRDTGIRLVGSESGLPAPRGFTLIEIVLALAITAMVIGAVFAIAKTATSMTHEISQSQERITLSQSFTDLLRRTFEQTPGNAKIELKILEQHGGGAALSDVVFQDYPLAFAWAGVESGAKTVIFRTFIDRRGSLGAKILYLTEEQAEDYSRGNLRENDAVASLVLVEGMQFCQWYFWDERTEEWVDSWDAIKYPNRRPSLVNLYLRFNDENMNSSNPPPGENVTFWVPTMASPETYAGAGAGGLGGGGGGPGGGRGGDGGAGGGPDGRGGPPGMGPGGGGRPEGRGGGPGGGGGRQGGGGGPRGGGGGGGPRGGGGGGGR